MTNRDGITTFANRASDWPQLRQAISNGRALDEVSWRRWRWPSIRQGSRPATEAADSSGTTIARTAGEKSSKALDCNRHKPLSSVSTFEPTARWTSSAKNL